MKRLVLHSPSMSFDGRAGPLGPDLDLKAFFEVICVLGSRLEHLTLDHIVRIDTFLAYAVQSQAASPWHCIRNFVMRSFKPYSTSDICNIVATIIQLLPDMPALETLNIELFEGSEGSMPIILASKKVKIKLEFIRSANQEDHVLLAIEGPIRLTVETIDAWSHAIQKTRDVPLKVLTTEALVDEYDYDNEEEEEDDEEDDEEDEEEDEEEEEDGENEEDDDGEDGEVDF